MLQLSGQAVGFPNQNGIKGSGGASPTTPGQGGVYDARGRMWAFTTGSLAPGLQEAAVGTKGVATSSAGNGKTTRGNDEHPGPAGSFPEGSTQTASVQELGLVMLG